MFNPLPKYQQMQFRCILTFLKLQQEEIKDLQHQTRSLPTKLQHARIDLTTLVEFESQVFHERKNMFITCQTLKPCKPMLLFQNRTLLIFFYKYIKINFSAIQWGSRKASVTWMLADCVKELQDISRHWVPYIIIIYNRQIEKKIKY